MRPRTRLAVVEKVGRGESGGGEPVHRRSFEIRPSSPVISVESMTTPRRDGPHEDASTQAAIRRHSGFVALAQGNLVLYPV
jgi:hypothetical protein